MLSVLFEGVGYSEINLRLMKNNRYLYIKAPVWLFSIGLGLLASTGAFGVEIMKPEQATTEIRIFIFIIVCQGLFQREWVIVLRVYEGR